MVAFEVFGLHYSGFIAPEQDCMDEPHVVFLEGPSAARVTVLPAP